MTRIIAGRAGGVALEVPGSGTRPTSDRVRESLFAALESAGALAGARVVDLYAGSGALGLEALSRGAASVDLVERAPVAVTAARRNGARVARALGGEDTSGSAPALRVHRTTVTAFLRSARGPFDLAFLDPPYDLADDELTAALIALGPHVAPEGLVVVERSRRSLEPRWADAGLEALRDRTYGDTTMWWGQPRSVSQS